MNLRATIALTASLATLTGCPKTPVEANRVLQCEQVEMQIPQGGSALIPHCEANALFQVLPGQFAKLDLDPESISGIVWRQEPDSGFMRVTFVDYRYEIGREISTSLDLGEKDNPQTLVPTPLNITVLPPIITGEINAPETVNLGETFGVGLTVEGPPDTLTYDWTDSSADFVVNQPTAEAPKFTPLAVGTYELRVLVEDTQPMSDAFVQLSTQVTVVDPSMVTGTFTRNPEGAELTGPDLSITFTADQDVQARVRESPNGGFRWAISPCPFSGGACTPTSPMWTSRFPYGDYTVSMEAYDDAGVFARAMDSFSVVDRTPVAVLSYEIDEMTGQLSLDGTQSMNADECRFRVFHRNTGSDVWTMFDEQPFSSECTADIANVPSVGQRSAELTVRNAELLEDKAETGIF